MHAAAPEQGVEHLREKIRTCLRGRPAGGGYVAWEGRRGLLKSLQGRKRSKTGRVDMAFLSFCSPVSGSRGGGWGGCAGQGGGTGLFLEASLLCRRTLRTDGPRTVCSALSSLNHGAGRGKWPSCGESCSEVPAHAQLDWWDHILTLGPQSIYCDVIQSRRQMSVHSL